MFVANAGILQSLYRIQNLSADRDAMARMLPYTLDGGLPITAKFKHEQESYRDYTNTNKTLPPDHPILLVITLVYLGPVTMYVHTNRTATQLTQYISITSHANQSMLTLKPHISMLTLKPHISMLTLMPHISMLTLSHISMLTLMPHISIHTLKPHISMLTLPHISILAHIVSHFHAHIKASHFHAHIKASHFHAHIQ